MTGKVKWFDVRKRYGYVVAEDGTEAFVHVSEINNGRTYKGLNQDDEVEFDIVDGKKGPQATNVNLISK